MGHNVMDHGSVIEIKRQGRVTLALKEKLPVDGEEEEMKSIMSSTNRLPGGVGAAHYPLIKLSLATSNFSADRLSMNGLSVHKAFRC